MMLVLAAVVLRGGRVLAVRPYLKRFRWPVPVSQQRVRKQVALRVARPQRCDKLATQLGGVNAFA